MEDCCYFAGYITDQGYGKIFGDDQKAYYAHRVMYENTFGDIAPGLVIDHLCRNRSCINPDHLEVVTNKENVLRGEGPTAQHACKTHCPQGHEYDAERRKNGSRRCSICARAQDRERSQLRYRKELAERGKTPRSYQPRCSS